MAIVRMGNLREYRCHIGHCYGLQSMIAQKAEAVEDTLNSALAQSEEMTSLLESSLSCAPPASTRDICAEIAKLRREQEIIRRLTSRCREPAVVE